MVYGELFLPFFRGIHILDSYDAVYQLRFGHPVWRSLVTAVRILLNIGPPVSKENFPGCKYTWEKFGRQSPKTLPPVPASLYLLITLDVRQYDTQVQCHSALVSSRVVCFVELIQ